MITEFPDDIVFDQENISHEQSVIRAKLLQGICPICGKGPYQMVASHAVRMHEIDGVTLRRMAAFNSRDAAIADPEHRERQSVKTKARWSTMPAKEKEEVISRIVGYRQPKELRTITARRAQANKSKETRSRVAGLAASALHNARTPTERKQAALHANQFVSPEGRTRAGKAGGAATVANTTPEEMRQRMAVASSKQGREARARAGRASATKQLEARKAGESAKQYRLTAEIVRDVRANYANKLENQRQISERLGVTQSLVSLIVNRKVWDWVE